MSRRPRGWLMLPLLAIATMGSVSRDVPLVEAAKKADSDAVRTVLQRAGDINAAEADGATALHWAAYLDDVETVTLLLEAGANPNAVTRYGVRPLLLAGTNGNLAVIDMLLRAGANPDARIGTGETALMTAARGGRLGAVNVLLAHGADVNARESWKGQTALMWAAAEGHVAVVETLIAHGASVLARSTRGFTPLLYAVREGRIEALRALLAAGSRADEMLPPGNEGPVEPATTLDVAADAAGGTSALVLAVRNAHYELATTLLEAGADPDTAVQGWTALHEITWVRRPGRGANFPGPVGSGNVDSIEFVRRLVKDGADPNARMTRRPRNGLLSALNRIGATPFLLAARAADVPLMRLLVELGADPLIPNSEGTTPLMAAAGIGVHSPGEDAGTEAEALEAARLAWQLGGGIDAVDENGETAMHGAAYLGANSIARFLVENGAKIDVWNTRNRYGWTPLTIAEGVLRTGNLRAAPHTAVLLRQLIADAANQPAVRR